MREKILCDQQVLEERSFMTVRFKESSCNCIDLVCVI